MPKYSAEAVAKFATDNVGKYYECEYNHCGEKQVGVIIGYSAGEYIKDGSCIYIFIGGDIATTSIPSPMGFVRYFLTEEQKSKFCGWGKSKEDRFGNVIYGITLGGMGGKIVSSLPAPKKKEKKKSAGNKPWHSDVYSALHQYEKMDELDKAWQATKADEYYFSVMNLDGETNVYIVPIDYFNSEKCMWDQSMNLEHILPDYMSESMECVWVADKNGDMTQVKDDMLARGFVPSKKLDRYVVDTYGD